MCTSPMWRIPVPELVKNSIFVKQPSYKNGAFVFSCKHQDRYEYITTMWQRYSPRTFSNRKDDIVKIPCGKCLECRLATSKQWAQRSVCEAQSHEFNWFVTLTYDDEHLPPPIYTYSRHSFDFGSWSPLLYSDFEKFKKRLLEYMRYHFNVTEIRFLMCGEYGPTNGRPHFHCIFYNLPLPDVTKHNHVLVSGRNYSYLHSQIVEDCWSKGFITIGEVNWDTSAYVGRYVMKKLTNLEEEDYQNLCKQNGWQPLPPEMRQASRRPGLGRPYFESHKGDIYAFDKVVLPNGRVAKPCSYFDRLFDLEDPELLKSIKKHRRDVQYVREYNERLNFKSDEEYEEYKIKQSEQFARKIKKLTRPL